MKLFHLLALAASFSGVAQAQSKFLSSPEQARQAAEGIVASVAAGNFSAAIKELKPMSVLPSGEIDVLEAQLNSQIAALLQRFGSPVGYEFIRQEKAGSSLLKLTFVVQYQKAPMRWVFVFYRTEKGWVSTDFRFDANALALFGSEG